MAGYVRQSEALIQDGEVIDAGDLNPEFDQLELAFDATGGHIHSGTVGDGPQIPLTTGVTGILPVANGGLGIGAFGAGSIPFSNGITFAQDGANLFWDDTNNRLGVGTNSPVYRVHIHSTTAVATGMLVTNSATGATGGDGLLVQVDDTGNGFLWNYENKKIYIGNNNAVSAVFNASGNLSLGNANDTYKLDVTGSIHASVNTIIDGSLAVGVNASVAGNLGVTGTGTIGTLSVTGGASVTGALSAGSISSPSATISNITVSGTVSAGAVTASGAITGSSLVTSSIANVGSLQLSGVNTLARDGTYTIMYSPNGFARMYLGGSDAANYYDNTIHRFRTAGGGDNHTTIDAANLVTRGGIFSGSVSVAGGLTTGVSGIGTTGSITASGAGGFSGSLTCSGLTTTSSGLNITGTGVFNGSITVASNTITQGYTQAFSGAYVSGAYSGDAGGHTLYVNGNSYAGQHHASTGFFLAGFSGTFGTSGMYQIGSSVVFSAHTPSAAYIQHDTATSNWYVGNSNGAGGLQWTASDGRFRNYQGDVAGAGAYQNFSDRRLKKNIAPTERGLSEILALNPVSFNRISTFRETPTELGFIAQEVRESGITEAVQESPNHLDPEDTPILSLSYDAITTCLVNAVKTMHETIENLQATITTLQDRIHTLEQGS